MPMLIINRHRLAAVSLGLLMSTPFGAFAALDDIVIVHGSATNGSTQVSLGFDPSGGQDDSQRLDVDLIGRQQLCENLLAIAQSLLPPGEYQSDTPITDAVRETIYDAMTGTNAMVATNFGAAQAASSIERATENFERRCQDPPELDAGYTIVFTSCSMLMRQGGQVLLWVTPPESPQAGMIIYDAQTREVLASLNLEVALGTLQRTLPDALGTTNPGGQSSVSLTGDAEPVELVISWGQPELWLTSVETFAAEHYDHSYNGQLRFGQIPFARVSGMGTATLSSEVPGHDVISEFYRNFRDHVTANFDSSTLIAEMFKHMANVASYGVPISFSQTTSSRMFIGPGVSSTDSNEVEGIGVYFGGAAREGFCGEIGMPTGWTVTDLDEMMSESMEGLEDLPAGFGDIFNQPQSSEQASAVPSWESLTQGAGSQPATVTSPTEGSSCVVGTSSDDLTTDDLAQSIQLHLEALGYDPGNTTGNLSVITQIAISQFQADQELEVTGEVSPQLLELLAKVVDAGC